MTKGNRVLASLPLLFHRFIPQEAEAWLGGKAHPAPLGNVAKQKDDGTWKHRLIQYLRMNGVNSASYLTERQVLPRGLDHAVDLARLQDRAGVAEEVWTLVLDLKDAFMSLPLAEGEQRFNCAHAGFEVRRDRDPLYHDEPHSGHFVVWRVLGFGGKPNPLVFARAASFAARSAQALLGPWQEQDRADAQACRRLAPGRLQMYVDDPVLSCLGAEKECKLSFDLVILWWMLLGIPLSWKKGSIYPQNVEHRWIGIDYTLVDTGARMRLPPDFVAELLILLLPLRSASGFMKTTELDIIVGKSARVAFVVPSAKPFVAALWGALAGANKARAAGVKEAPPGHLPCRRFSHAAAWISALLEEKESCPLPLERIVRARPPARASTSGWRAEFDASIYGGGGVLRSPDGIVRRHFVTLWNNDLAAHLQVVTGDPKHQTFWEFLTLLIVLILWGDDFVEVSLAVLGDNTGSLSSALRLQGRGAMLAVAREVSWRTTRRRWAFEVGHLPTEHNTIADALSRVADPSPKSWPATALASSEADKVPDLSKIWLARPS